MEAAESLSIMDGDGSYAIAINPWKMEMLEQETVSLAHELGHCETGNFYNRCAVLDVQQKHENRANKSAIHRLIPRVELEQAVESGCVTFWDLADRFGVTEDLMRKAVCLYQHGNLAAECYW